MKLEFGTRNDCSNKFTKKSYFKRLKNNFARLVYLYQKNYHAPITFVVSKHAGKGRDKTKRSETEIILV